MRKYKNKSLLKEALRYQIGLTLLPGIGDILAKSLVSYCGSAEAVFKSKSSHLQKIPGIGYKIASDIIGHKVFERVETELLFIEKNKIKPLFYLDEQYPQRLQHCADSPVMLYYKGNSDLNGRKMISIIGTRNASGYGKMICQNIIKEISSYDDVVIISGLAYGIDITAHKAAINNGVQTIGILGHGLDRVYPLAHRSTAIKMLKKGGLLTEFPSSTTPDRENFPKRNRIIAGMSDAVIIMESGKRGGAIITAEIANSYNRDVFAIPGKVATNGSNGANFLIKSHRASLIESGKDIAYLLGWEQKETNIAPQKELMLDLEGNEKKIVNLLIEKGASHIDTICLKTALGMSEVASLLLNLEMTGIVVSMPGKKYAIT